MNRSSTGRTNRPDYVAQALAGTQLPPGSQLATEELRGSNYDHRNALRCSRRRTTCAAQDRRGRHLAGTGIVMHPAYAKAIAQFAYVWGWPMVNMLNRRDAITKAPHPGRLNGVLPVAPRGQVAMLFDYIDPGQTFVTCPNQDVVYGLGFFSLDEEPVVLQVPDFGDRFWVYALYDARTDQFAEIGKPYKTKPGFYRLVGPNWKGEKPAGIEAVIMSSTPLANAIPRVFMDDSTEDRKAIQSGSTRLSSTPSRTSTER